MTIPITLDERVGLVDPADLDGGRPRVREPHRHGVTDRQVVLCRGRGVDEQLVLGEGGAPARRHPQDDGIGEVLWCHPGERRECGLELELIPVHGVGRGNPGHGGNRRLWITCAQRVASVWIWPGIPRIPTPTASSALWTTMDDAARPGIRYPYVVAHGGALAE